MRKRSIIALAVLCLAVAATVVAAWLVYTTVGSRLLVATLFRVMPVTVEAERITGQLARELTVEGLRAVWPDGCATTANCRAIGKC